MLLPSDPPFLVTNTVPTQTYTLSLHDALPIWPRNCSKRSNRPSAKKQSRPIGTQNMPRHCSSSTLSGSRRCSKNRSEEQTSELQSLTNIVCRVLLEKKQTQSTLKLSSLSPRL